MNNKLLYIIDDEKGRQQTKYKVFVEVAQIDPKRIKLIHHTTEISVDEIIDNAACVCVHESMSNGIDQNGQGFSFGLLRQKLKINSIPRVFFSNVANKLTILNLPFRLTMKSDDFYMNLPYFVKPFQERGVIDLELLALGKNYNREKVIRLKNEMLLYFEEFDRDEPLSLSVEDRVAFKTQLEEFEQLSKQRLADTAFRSLNAKKLTRTNFEQMLHAIIKFIR